jgi:hypothetical protein
MRSVVFILTQSILSTANCKQVNPVVIVKCWKFSASVACVELLLTTVSDHKDHVLLLLSI